MSGKWQLRDAQSNDLPGSFTSDQIREMLTRGQISREHLVFKEGWLGWESLGRALTLNLFGDEPAAHSAELVGTSAHGSGAVSRSAIEARNARPAARPIMMAGEGPAAQAAYSSPTDTRAPRRSSIEVFPRPGFPSRLGRWLMPVFWGLAVAIILTSLVAYATDARIAEARGELASSSRRLAAWSWYLLKVLATAMVLVAVWALCEATTLLRSMTADPAQR